MKNKKTELRCENLEIGEKNNTFVCKFKFADLQCIGKVLHFLESFEYLNTVLICRLFIIQVNEKCAMKLTKSYVT